MHHAEYQKRLVVIVLLAVAPATPVIDAIGQPVTDARPGAAPATPIRESQEPASQQEAAVPLGADGGEIRAQDLTGQVTDPAANAGTQPQEVVFPAGRWVGSYRPKGAGDSFDAIYYVCPDGRMVIDLYSGGQRDRRRVSTDALWSELSVEFTKRHNEYCRLTRAKNDVAFQGRCVDPKNENTIKAPYISIMDHQPIVNLEVCHTAPDGSQK